MVNLPLLPHPAATVSLPRPHPAVTVNPPLPPLRAVTENLLRPLRQAVTVSLPRPLPAATVRLLLQEVTDSNRPDMQCCPVAELQKIQYSYGGQLTEVGPRNFLHGRQHDRTT